MSDTGGATAMEYALIGTLISIIILTALTNVGSNLATFFASVASGVG